MGVLVFIVDKGGPVSATCTVSESGWMEKDTSFSAGSRRCLSHLYTSTSGHRSSCASI